MYKRHLIILRVVLLAFLYFFSTINGQATVVQTRTTMEVKSPKKKKKTRIKIPQYSKKIIEAQLMKIPISIDYKLNKDILYFIQAYTLLAREKTEGTLGRTFLYFPIFEKYLDKYNLPSDLKALAIIESALRPEARSKKGATGLWQFMPRTAQQYDININDYVDERNDPTKSTEAAMRHLSKLYDHFGNWNLAIAAYNCGSTRMRKAIKKAKSRDYRKVKRHLPKETQRYVQKYVAANYVMNYYMFYDMHPRYPDYNYTVTETVNISDYTTFQNLQKETGIAMGVLEKLNPAYKKGIVPPNVQGNYIVIPKIGSKKEDTKVLAKQKD